MELQLGPQIGSHRICLSDAGLYLEYGVASVYRRALAFAGYFYSLEKDAPVLNEVEFRFLGDKPSRKFSIARFLECGSSDDARNDFIDKAPTMNFTAPPAVIQGAPVAAYGVATNVAPSAGGGVGIMTPGGGSISISTP